MEEKLSAFPPPPPAESPHSKPLKKRSIPLKIPKEIIEPEIIPPSGAEVISEPMDAEEDLDLPVEPVIFPAEIYVKVYELARYGAHPGVIAKHIDHPNEKRPLSMEELWVYFSEQIKTGARQGAEENLKAIHEQAIGDKKGKRNIVASMFRAKQDPLVGFTEKQEVSHTHISVKDDALHTRINRLDDNDLKQLRAILAKRIEEPRNNTSRTPRIGRRNTSSADDGESSK